MALDPNRWTVKVQEAFNEAISLARARNNPELTPHHLLAAMLGQDGTLVLPVLERVGVAPLSLKNKVEDALDKLPKAYGGGEGPMSRARRGALGRAGGARAGPGDECLPLGTGLAPLPQM